ncbi:MAG: beta-galactosidase [Burkholderiaceae bacterium]
MSNTLPGGTVPPLALGVCYYPEQWPEQRWAADARAMRELGIEVVRIAEFAWARIEPVPGRFDWDWLDRAVATLAGEGLRLVLGTPTAAPPAWLALDEPGVLPVDAQGRTKGFGARRHYCFSSPALHAATRRVVEAMARRYGRHEAVVGWQIDNEYGCHDTTLSYSPAALAAFRAWLAERYGDVEALNAAWGTGFWSLHLRGFDDVGFPVGQPAPALPAHELDWRRFSSDAVARYNRLQADILRRHSPGRAVLHNFMGLFADFDHHDVARELDVAAWDSYPLGHTEVAPFLDEGDRQRWARTGHPDMAAFHHDLYRGVGRGRMWVMEQQAGPVNWAPWNALPAPGMVRAWTWEAFAHGAELVSYFRWRQLPYAQEQLHSGLHRPDGGRAPGGDEAASVVAERDALRGSDLALRPAPVALVLDYPSLWMAQVQPHGADMAPMGLPFAYYSALRRLGLDVDFVGPDDALDGRALVVVAGVLRADEVLARRLADSGAVVVLGPRSGSKTAQMAVAEPAPPGPLAQGLPMAVRAVESLRPGLLAPLASGGHGLRWRDLVEPLAGTAVRSRYADGWPAWLGHGRWQAHAGLVDAHTLQRWLADAAEAAGLAVTSLDAPGATDSGLRLRRRGAWQFAVNHGAAPATVPAPAGAVFALGGRELPPAGVAAWRIPGEGPGEGPA